LNYMAPEQLQGEDSPLRAGSRESDVWSVGVIAYMIFCGHRPFDADTDEGTKKRIRGGNLRFPPKWWNNMPEAADFIKDVLVLEPDARLTTAQLLEHPWLVTTAAQFDPQKQVGKATPPPSPRSADPSQAINIPRLCVRRLAAFKEEKLLRRLSLLVVALNLNQSDLVPAQQAYLSVDKVGSELDAATLAQALRLSPPPAVSEEEEQQESEGRCDGRVRSSNGREALPEPTPESMVLFDELSCRQPMVSYTEFLAAVMERAVFLDRPLLYRAFQVLDQDADGFITALDLEQLLGGWCEGLNMRQIVSQADFDGAGLVSREHWLHMMLGTTPDFGDPLELLACCSDLHEKVVVLQVET